MFIFAVYRRGQLSGNVYEDEEIQSFGEEIDASVEKDIPPVVIEEEEDDDLELLDELDSL